MLESQKEEWRVKETSTNYQKKTLGRELRESQSIPYKSERFIRLYNVEIVSWPCRSDTYWDPLEVLTSTRLKNLGADWRDVPFEAIKVGITKNFCRNFVCKLYANGTRHCRRESRMPLREIHNSYVGSTTTFAILPRRLIPATNTFRYWKDCDS